MNISNYLPVLCYDGKIGRSVVCASALTVQPPAETAVRPQLQPQQWGDNKQSVEPSQGVLTLLTPHSSTSHYGEVSPPPATTRKERPPAPRLEEVTGEM